MKSKINQNNYSISYVTDFFFFGVFLGGDDKSSSSFSSLSIFSSINGCSGDGGRSKFPNVFCFVLLLTIVAINDLSRVSLIDLSC